MGYFCHNGFGLFSQNRRMGLITWSQVELSWHQGFREAHIRVEAVWRKALKTAPAAGQSCPRHRETRRASAPRCQSRA